MSKTAAIFFALCAFLCYSCSWVDDDRSDCSTGCWLRLSYTYNMFGVDAASTQVKDATLFIFDQEGRQIKQEIVDSVILHKYQYKIPVPSLPQGNYSFLVWSGLDESLYDYTPASISLLADENGECNKQLPYLFHGRLDKIFVDGAYQVLTVPLVKNTNVLSCVLQNQSALPLKLDDFRLELTARNAVIDHWNMPSQQESTCYLPFMSESAQMGSVEVAHFGLNTLRLMENDDTALRLIYTPSGKSIFNISLTPYLLLARNVDSKSMAPQEYLDREDRYNLIFFLEPSGDPDKPYICLQMKVNGWIVRINDAELETNC